MERAIFISSDGHATAEMADYRPYLAADMREEFDEFLVKYEAHGSHSSDRRNLESRLDKEEMDRWQKEVLDSRKIEGRWDGKRRLEVMEEEGTAAEVLFPDFGIPFEMYSPSTAAILGDEGMTENQMRAARPAYNRWLADYVSVAPQRFAAQAMVGFHDVEGALAEIRWAKDNGFRGVILPRMSHSRPVFHPDFEPIWSLLEELELPLNIHPALSSVSDAAEDAPPPTPHPAVAGMLYVPKLQFLVRQLLHHFIYSGILENHPKLKVVFTEAQSDWTLAALRAMDYTFRGSFARTDIRELVPLLPSEYFARQCYLGASLFSRAEIAARHQIGLDKIMIGADYPHHEGTMKAGTFNYLQATLGAERVPRDEADRMLSGNAIEVFGFDPEVLAPVAARSGFPYEDMLTPPPENTIFRGDVNRPLAYVS